MQYNRLVRDAERGKPDPLLRLPHPKRDRDRDQSSQRKRAGLHQ